MKSKKYVKALEKIDKSKEYEPKEAIELAKEASAASFDSAVEFHARLGIDPRQGDQQVRSTVTLPHGIGKTKKIAAFVEHNKEAGAKKAGAAIVGGEELIKEIKQSEKINFTEAVATPTMMPKLAGIAKILGPKGLMPSPKNETVGADIVPMIEAIKKGKLSYKNDDTGNIHFTIGRVSFDTEKLLENFTNALESLKKNRPPGAKGTYLKAVYLSTTMGPSIRVNIN